MASNPLGIFQAALANGPQSQPVDVGRVLGTNQALQAEAAQRQQEAALAAQEVALKRRQIDNMNRIRQAAPVLLDKSGGKWDDSVYGGLVQAGVDPMEVEKLKGLRLENDSTAAKTADLNAAAAEAQQKLAEQKRIVAGRIGTAMQKAKLPDGTYDPVGVEAVISNWESSDPNWKGGGQLRQLYAQNPAAFDQKMQMAAANAPEIAAEQAKLEAQKTETALEQARIPQIQAETALQQEQAKRMALQRQMMEQAAKDPTHAQAAIDELTKDDPELNKQAHAAYIQRMQLEGPEGASKVVGTLFDQVAQKRMAVWEKTNPTLVDAEVNKAGRIAQAQNNAFTLSPDAVDMAARQYRETGQMPSIARNRAAQKQIMDRAAALGPIDLASNQAAFKANEEALKGLQKNLDSVTAFENTAKKNLDLFLDQAKKVIDTGSPWLNRPLRSVARGGLGSADQAAYDTARQVAINEIAKVTGDPGLSGHLSDSARHEVEAFNPNSATLAQTYKVAQVLKQDMENRRQSYQDQIADIKRRIGGGQQNTQPKATHRFNPATGKIEPVQ